MIAEISFLGGIVVFFIVIIKLANRDAKRLGINNK